MYVLLDASFLRYWFNSIVLNKLQYVWVFSLSELLKLLYLSSIYVTLSYLSFVLVSVHLVVRVIEHFSLPLTTLVSGQ
ncbi:hypothetical protein AQUCO_58300001v1 [Aquilegia coerulea]|uniref:Uncharacterized protein n=1 Tax=Aquilegia coerulea TaxID=218851 RepID=A0A2G5C0E3_AQUCA|nr:hypothetical protein AQUCO_58300001v1 [Aquilegia coerulea]